MKQKEITGKNKVVKTNDSSLIQHSTSPLQSNATTDIPIW
jgi:hypothetical protein